MDNNAYRKALIARVEALRLSAAMPMLIFHHRMGPVAARNWKRFASASDEEAWEHFSLRTMDRIAQIFDTGAAIMQFRSSGSTSQGTAQ